MSNIHERIKELRKERDLTQEQLGEKIGMVKSTISLYESGKSTPDDGTKFKLADLFGVSLDYLLGRTDNKNVIVCASKEESANIEKRLLKMMVEAGKITQEEADSGVINPDVEEEIMSMIEAAIEFAEKLAK